MIKNMIMCSSMITAATDISDGIVQTEVGAGLFFISPCAARLRPTIQSTGLQAAGLNF